MLIRERRKRYVKHECKAGVFKACTLRINTPGRLANICVLSPRNIEVLNMSQSLSATLDHIPPTIVLGTSRLRYFEFRGNGLTYITGPFMINRPRATGQLTMDFRDNGIVCLAKEFFGYSVNKGLDVGKLNLAGNNLWEQLGQDTEGDTFADYGNLTELNLAYNQIKTLPKRIFHNIPRLKLLNLSGNSLQLIEFDQTHFNRLEMLDLSSNLLIQLDADTRRVLTNLFTTCVNLSLNVVGNPLQCSCESLGFLKWLKLNKNRVTYYENTTCLLDNILHNFTDLDDLVNKLDFDCSKPLAMIVTGSLFGITVLAIVLSVFLYRHRWDIRYFLLKLSQKGKVYQKLVDLSKDYVYDAFVAYDKNDRNWVVKELIPNLETSGEQRGDENPDAIREPMRLCIHERDFQLGNWIEENIVTAIEQSRQIILVVSSHFWEQLVSIRIGGSQDAELGAWKKSHRSNSAGGCFVGKYASQFTVHRSQAYLRRVEGG